MNQYKHRACRNKSSQTDIELLLEYKGNIEFKKELNKWKFVQTEEEVVTKSKPLQIFKNTVKKIKVLKVIHDAKETKEKVSTIKKLQEKVSFRSAKKYRRKITKLGTVVESSLSKPLISRKPVTKKSGKNHNFQ